MNYNKLMGYFVPNINIYNRVETFHETSLQVKCFPYSNILYPAATESRNLFHGFMNYSG